MRYVDGSGGVGGVLSLGPLLASSPKGRFVLELEKAYRSWPCAKIVKPNAKANAPSLREGIRVGPNEQTPFEDLRIACPLTPLLLSVTIVIDNILKPFRA